MPPPSAIPAGGSVQQGLSVAYEPSACFKHRLAADKRYSLGFAMVNMLPSILLPVLPFVLAAFAGAWWWRQLSSPLLFAVTAALSLFGFQALLSFLWDFWPNISSSMVLIQRVQTEAEVQHFFEEKNRAAIIQAIVVILVSVPFLWWLKNGLSSSATA
ncbi:hypothetical protein LP414_15505 [Polaromonas sp. P1(28)-13]|nr:hypothetical protein LP414_15505 [Polaromonas sp. P1(28)-13]